MEEEGTGEAVEPRRSLIGVDERPMLPDDARLLHRDVDFELSCPHFSVSATELITRFRASDERRLPLVRCGKCGRKQGRDPAPPLSDAARQWVCMLCPSLNARCEAHRREHVAEGHRVFVDLASFRLCCFACKADVQNSERLRLCAPFRSCVADLSARRAPCGRKAQGPAASPPGKDLAAPRFTFSPKASPPQGSVKSQRLHSKLAPPVVGLPRASRAGLANLGNTCYLNAALQAIRHCAVFAQYFSDVGMAMGAFAEDKLVYEFSRTLQMMLASDTGSLAPSALVSVVRGTNPQFSGYGQQDAQEFVRWLLDSVHEALKVDVPASAAAGGAAPVRQPPRSIVRDVFEGRIVGEVRCEDCHHVSKREDPFMDLSVPVPTPGELDALYEVQDQFGAGMGLLPERARPRWYESWLLFQSERFTLIQSIASFFAKEHLSGENRVNCDRCKRATNSIRSSRISCLPPILCVHIKRFRFDGYYGLGSKITDSVNCPLDQLDMRPFCSETLLRRKNPGSTTYNLVATINHRGSSLSSGHYVSYGLNSAADLWYEYDDTAVTQVSPETVELSEPYVLMYLRSDYYRVDIDASRSLSLLRFPLSTGGESELASSVRLSRDWYYHYLVTSGTPVPIGRGPWVCQHGLLKVSSDLGQRLTMPILDEAWEKLAAQFGGGTVLRALEVCEPCTMLERIRRDEMKTMNTLSTRRPRPGEMWYFLPSWWVHQWLKFRDGAGDRPGRIDTSELISYVRRLCSTGAAATRSQHTPPKRPKVNAVTPLVWNFLSDRYQTGTAVRSRTHNLADAVLSDVAQSADDDDDDEDEDEIDDGEEGEEEDEEEDEDEDEDGDDGAGDSGDGVSAAEPPAEGATTPTSAKCTVS